MLKPKYIENILSITKEKRGEIECDVVCECGARHFIGYKNVIVRSAEEAAYESAFNAFNKNTVVFALVMKTVFLTFTE